MIIKIIESIIMIILVIIAICSIAFMIMAHCSLKKCTSKRGTKNLKKIRVTAITTFLVSVSGLFFVYRAIEQYDQTNRSYKSSGLAEDNQKYLAALLDKLPFHDEIRNEEQTIWEHLICDELSYNKYLKWAELASDFDELWETYQNEIVEVHKLPVTEIDELREHVDFFYGSEILPFTDKTLPEVEEEILPLDERINTDMEVFKNEFWLRASKCGTDSSDEKLYQAGRASDDEFKVLIKNKQGSYKEIIYYGSMAVGFYLASIKNYEGNIDVSFMYYRIAEIYIYLDRYVDLGEDDGIYTHCRLMSVIYLTLAEAEYENSEHEGDINEKLPYFSCYYKDLSDMFITVYKSDDEDLISMSESTDGIMDDHFTQ